MATLSDGYRCSTCGGWFNGTHFCVGKPYEGTHTYTWPPKSDRQKELDEAAMKWNGTLSRQELIDILEEAIRKLRRANG